VSHRCLATLIIAMLWLTLGCDEPADEETDLSSDSAGPDVSGSWLSDACIKRSANTVRACIETQRVKMIATAMNFPAGGLDYDDDGAHGTCGRHGLCTVDH